MQATVSASAVQQKTDPRAGKYISFRLANEEFAIPVLRVREIVGIQEITAVPQTPQGVKGVINLRGRVIPVVDLRLKFGLAEIEYSERTCIIVVQIDAARSAGAPGEGPGASLLVGVIVDAVSEVLNLQAGDIENTPDFGTGVALPYLLGMAKIKGQVKILLDIQALLAGGELASLAGLGSL
ncbi:MAG TPA: chemotaxis protein CheW [Bryobacteraceae bacterium]|nr:chemotaxis protein CheW [Bryobacteraceae bacterium]